MSNKDSDFQGLSGLFGKSQTKKPPAYKWQDLALKIITEFNVPVSKKSSVFKVCRDKSQDFIERCLADTRELSTGEEKWRYFFKVISEETKKHQV